MTAVSRGSADPFGEHISIMKSLYHEYQRRDELEGIAQVEALLLEVTQMCNMKEEKAKAMIRGGPTPPGGGGCQGQQDQTGQSCLSCA